MRIIVHLLFNFFIYDKDISFLTFLLFLIIEKVFILSKNSKLIFLNSYFLLKYHFSKLQRSLI